MQFIYKKPIFYILFHTITQIFTIWLSTFNKSLAKMLERSFDLRMSIKYGKIFGCLETVDLNNIPLKCCFSIETIYCGCLSCVSTARFLEAEYITFHIETSSRLHQRFCKISYFIFPLQFAKKKMQISHVWQKALCKHQMFLKISFGLK